MTTRTHNHMSPDQSNNLWSPRSDDIHLRSIASENRSTEESSTTAVPLGDKIMSDSKSSISGDEPRLLHPALSLIPTQVRFGINGLLGNVIFMIMYNYCIEKFDHAHAASTIYAVVYFFYIPLGHALASLLVFGWPTQYVSNLLSNYPIGLTSIAIGSGLTAYLDSMDFNGRVGRFVHHLSGVNQLSEEHEGGEFYSSIVVIIITGIWAYVLGGIVNNPKEEPEAKKEL